VPANAASTASDTLGGAVEIAGRLPHALAADVIEASREAFTPASVAVATQQACA
jgi:hypothetical protein